MNKKQHPLYSTWKNMKARCYVKSNLNYPYYGAKGVTVCERWREFWNFVEDIDNHMENGHLLYDSKYQLDKDLKGGNIYSLENCVVMLRKDNDELKLEKQRKKIVAINATDEIRFKSVAEASRQLNIPRGTVQKYLKIGEVHISGFSFKYID